MRKIFVVSLLLGILFIYGCASTGGVITPSYTTINVMANFTSKPEKNVEVYAVEGTPLGGYEKHEKFGPGVMRPKRVEYKGEKKFLGTTPLATTLTFRHYPIKGGYVWTPPAYAVYFVEASGKESNFVLGPWTLMYTDPATGETKETLYNPENFPFDYFRKHPSVRAVNVPFNFYLEIKE